MADRGSDRDSYPIAFNPSFDRESRDPLSQANRLLQHDPVKVGRVAEVDFHGSDEFFACGPVRIGIRVDEMSGREGVAPAAL